jgi:hypothetical protein
MLMGAFPERSRCQPAGVYRRLIASKSYVHVATARHLRAAVGTTVEKEMMNFDCLAAALIRSQPLLVGGNILDAGLCCVCSNRGALGRCGVCGTLFHHACVQPALPGQLPPCPICEGHGVEAGGPPEGVWPHDMEVGAPAPRTKVARIPVVGIDAGATVVTPFPEKELPDDEMAKRQGYASAQDWHRKILASSLSDAAVAGEFRQLQQASRYRREARRARTFSDGGERVSLPARSE